MSENTGIRDQVIEVLADSTRPMTSVEIAEEIGCERKPITDAVYALRLDGAIHFAIGEEGQKLNPPRYALGDGRGAPSVWVAPHVEIAAPAPTEQVVQPATSETTIPPGVRKLPPLPFAMRMQELIIAAEDDLSRYVESLNDVGLNQRLRLVEQLRDAQEVADEVGVY